MQPKYLFKKMIIEFVYDFNLILYYFPLINLFSSLYKVYFLFFYSSHFLSLIFFFNFRFFLGLPTTIANNHCRHPLSSTALSHPNQSDYFWFFVFVFIFIFVHSRRYWHRENTKPRTKQRKRKREKIQITTIMFFIFILFYFYFLL